MRRTIGRAEQLRKVENPPIDTSVPTRPTVNPSRILFILPFNIIPEIVTVTYALLDHIRRFLTLYYYIISIAIHPTITYLAYIILLLPH